MLAQYEVAAWLIQSVLPPEETSHGSNCKSSRRSRLISALWKVLLTHYPITITHTHSHSHTHAGELNPRCCLGAKTGSGDVTFPK